MGGGTPAATGSGNIASASYSTIGGGAVNMVSDENGTVGGGIGNHAGDNSGTEVDAESATVAGGRVNVASGAYSMVPGGKDNTAVGQYSFAAGRRAKANSNGVFAWADSTDQDFTVGTANQFAARASGGVKFYTNAALTTGVSVAAGGGSWSNLSDRDKKENIERVDPEEVLEKVSELPISTWNYIGSDPDIRHMGPMAQDLYAAFELGDSDKAITTIDADGVALAAIQGLHEKVNRKDEEIKTLHAEVAELKSIVHALLEEARGRGSDTADDQ